MSNGKRKCKCGVSVGSKNTCCPGCGKTRSLQEELLDFLETVIIDAGSVMKEVEGGGCTCSVVEKCKNISIHSSAILIYASELMDAKVRGSNDKNEQVCC